MDEVPPAPQPPRANPLLALPPIAAAAQQIWQAGRRSLQPRVDHDALLRAAAGTAALAAVVQQAAAVAPPEQPAVVEEDGMSSSDASELPFDPMDTSQMVLLDTDITTLIVDVLVISLDILSTFLDDLTTSILNTEIVNYIITLLNSGFF